MFESKLGQGKSLVPGFISRLSADRQGKKRDSKYTATCKNLGSSYEKRSWGSPGLYRIASRSWNQINSSRTRLLPVKSIVPGHFCLMNTCVVM
jgi:hypothetical protein